MDIKLARVPLVHPCRAKLSVPTSCRVRTASLVICLDMFRTYRLAVVMQVFRVSLGFQANLEGMDCQGHEVMMAQKVSSGMKGESGVKENCDSMGQSNWKQCAWRKHYDTDKGFIRVRMTVEILYIYCEKCNYILIV